MLASSPIPGNPSDCPIENGVSSHAVDDDSSGWAQQQGCHDDNGGQDDEDNDPDVQDVLGEHSFHRHLANSIHAAPLPDLLLSKPAALARSLAARDGVRCEESSQDRGGWSALPGRLRRWEGSGC